ncbi:hypothetical protein [Nocardioides sp. AE5]|uniref:hypothetical protein n=1 Tax=Nocardioides sp. AE5 TaxID=2962573 RepID=UPI00288141F1|nr:hypothetical protein [Nocardioides sp. AE5]MDT0202989.1 hypothetical protein [Nocardioides sp. AE5]
MSYEIDTHLAGTPAHFDSAATFLADALAPELQALADAAVLHRATLEEGWQGESGAAFRDAAGELAMAGDQLGKLALEMGGRVAALGAALAGFQDRMAEIRAEAVSKDLVLDGEKVRSPILDYINNGAGARIDELSTSYAEIQFARDQVVEQWHARLEEELGVIRANMAFVQEFTGTLLVSGSSSDLLAVHAPKMIAHTEMWTQRAISSAEVLAGCSPAVMEPRMPGIHAPKSGTKGVPTGPVLFLLGVHDDLQAGESTQQALLSRGAAAGAGMLTAAVVTPFAGPVIGGGSGAVVSSWMNKAVDSFYGKGCSGQRIAPPPTPAPAQVTPLRASEKEKRILSESTAAPVPVSGRSH